MNRRSFAILFMLATILPVCAQESHVHIYYSKDNDVTMVSSDHLYVVNMPTQFLQMTFVGRYPHPGAPTKMPDILTVEFASFSASALYEPEASHHLSIKTDDEILDVGLMGYVQSHQSGAIAYTEKDTAHFSKATIPESALVRANARKGLTLEFFTKDVKLEDLEKMAAAKQVLVKIGSGVFALTSTHMSILHEFVKNVTPGSPTTNTSVQTVAPSIPADVPSDANNATLQMTLKWLAKELEHTNPTKDSVPRKIRPVTFDSCEIRYRLDPVFRNSAMLDYKMNLGDLDPNSIVATSLPHSTVIWFRVRNSEPRIKLISRRNDSGAAGETIGERTFPSASITLNDADTAARFRVALAHAINLCQGRH